MCDYTARVKSRFHCTQNTKEWVQLKTHIGIIQKHLKPRKLLVYINWFGLCYYYIYPCYTIGLDELYALGNFYTCMSISHYWFRLIDLCYVVTTQYLKTNSLFEKHQSAYRQHHKTEIVLI